MTTSYEPRTAAAAVFLAPGEGPALRMGALPLVFKALSAWSGGAYEMHEHRIGPGVLVAPHTHAHQDQASYVLAGTIGCLVGGQEFEVSPYGASSGGPAASATHSGPPRQTGHGSSRSAPPALRSRSSSGVSAACPPRARPRRRRSVSWPRRTGSPTTWP